MPTTEAAGHLPQAHHTHGEGMFNLLPVILTLRQGVFGAVLQDCHSLATQGILLERFC